MDVKDPDPSVLKRDKDLAPADEHPHRVVLLLQMMVPDVPLLQLLHLRAKIVSRCSQKGSNTRREEREIPPVAKAKTKLKFSFYDVPC